MAKNQTVTATTQIGVVNGNVEGYATLAQLEAQLTPPVADTVDGAFLAAGGILNLTRTVGANLTADLSSLAGGGGGTADGVVTAGVLDGVTGILTVSRTIGADVSIDLSALLNGASPSADGVVTSATLDGANLLTLTRSVGADVTVDLSGLAAAANDTSVVSVDVDGVLSHSDGAAVPVVTTVDLPAVVSATATDAEANVLLAKGVNDVPDATVAQAAALDADDRVLVEIDPSGTMVMARVGDLPAPVTTNLIARWDAATMNFDMSGLTGVQVRYGSDPGASILQSSTWPVVTSIGGSGAPDGGGNSYNQFFGSINGGTWEFRNLNDANVLANSIAPASLGGFAFVSPSFKFAEVNMMDGNGFQMLFNNI